MLKKIEDNGHKNYLLLDSQILSHSIQCDAIFVTMLSLRKFTVWNEARSGTLCLSSRRVPKKSSKQVPSTGESSRACDLNLKKLSMSLRTCRASSLVRNADIVQVRNAPSFNTWSLCSYKYLCEPRELGLATKNNSCFWHQDVRVSRRDRTDLTLTVTTDSLEPRTRLHARKIYKTSTLFCPNLRNKRASVGMPSKQNEAVNMK